MKHLFVTYELALMLKEKGFDEDCLGLYHKEKGFVYPKGDFIGKGSIASIVHVLAPLYQQCIDWFREKHNLHLYIDTTPTFDKIQGSMYKATLKVPFQPFKWTTGHYYLGKTYYEALIKAIEEAIKLI